MKIFLMAILLLAEIVVLSWQAVTYQEYDGSAIAALSIITIEDVSLNDTNISRATSTRVSTIRDIKSIYRQEDIAINDINLAIPFQPQAPYADWSAPYNETCEEAAIIMVANFLDGNSLSPREMKDAIDEQVAWQVEQEFSLDLSIADTALLAEHFFDYDTEIIYNLTVERIIEQLQLGNPVIVPAAGRALGNPYFTPPGPLYHMLVIKGYKGDRFITNDPGTRRGADFTYNQDVLLNAIADWDGNSPDGPKIGLILHK